MRSGDGIGSLAAPDLERLGEILESYRTGTRARYAALIDRGGQLLTATGDTRGLDDTSFASLAAADFAASNQLAVLLGEEEFRALFHRGDGEGMYLLDVAGAAILAVIFGQDSTLGLLRLKSREVLPRLAEVFAELSGRRSAQVSPFGDGWLAEAEDEIDRLFGG